MGWCPIGSSNTYKYFTILFCVSKSSITPMFWVGSFYEISDQPKTGFGLGINNIEIFLFEKREGFLVYFKWEGGSRQHVRPPPFVIAIWIHHPPMGLSLLIRSLLTRKYNSIRSMGVSELKSPSDRTRMHIWPNFTNQI